MEYILKYVPEAMFEEIAMYTNIYALQNDKNKFRSTSNSEMQILFA